MSRAGNGERRPALDSSAGRLSASRRNAVFTFRHGRAAARWLASLAGIATIACGNADARGSALSDSVELARKDSVARARQDSINRAHPGYIIDSILPIEEELRRFRADLPNAPTAFANGAPTRDSLVRLFVRAVEQSDSLALRRLVLTRAEFAYLVYPSSPYTAPPYRQAPGLVWMMITGGSRAGYSRLLDRMGGRPLGFLGYRCATPPAREGPNRIWRDCALRVVRTSGDTVAMRLFGAIIEQRGRYKIVSYASDL
jgi:hypothetical protein